MSTRHPGISCGSAYSETYPYGGFHERNRAFAAIGTSLFFPCVVGGFGDDYWSTWFWRAADTWGDESDRTDGLALDDQVREILAINPQARFIVRWLANAPTDWRTANPDEVQQRSDGTRTNEGSFASAVFAAALCAQATRIVAWCRSRTWADRIDGYAAFPIGEGISLLTLEGGLIDHSPAMRRAWAQWQGQNGNQGSFPVEADWKQRQSTWKHWPEPVATRDVRDYFACQRQLYAQFHLGILRAIKAAAPESAAGIDALKQPLMGWQVQDHFAGAGGGSATAAMHPASGMSGVAALLDDPALDFIITPADYHARAVGWGFEAEGIADPLILRGKTMLIEDDCRSWIGKEATTQGAWRNEAEMRAGTLRNFGLASSRGHFAYWMNVGDGFFAHDRIMAEMAAHIPMRENLATRRWHDTEHAIGVLLDDRSQDDENCTSGFQNLAVIRQRLDELSRTGLPYRIHLLDDLERADFPRYRCWYLPNCFRLDGPRIALIRERLCRDGSVVILGPGTGISDGQRLSAEGISALTGHPFSLIDRSVARRILVSPGDHPALAGLQQAHVYGDSLCYGPLLVPDSGGVELGRLSAYWGTNSAGLSYHPRGHGAGLNLGPHDGAMVFSAAVPMPADLLRSLALHAGCVPWSDLGDAVGAGEDVLCVHSVRSGRRTIHLPRICTVRDASTHVVMAEKTACFEIQMQAPETRIFLLD